MDVGERWEVSQNGENYWPSLLTRAGISVPQHLQQALLQDGKIMEVRIDTPIGRDEPNFREPDALRIFYIIEKDWKAIEYLTHSLIARKLSAGWRETEFTRVADSNELEIVLGSTMPFILPARLSGVEFLTNVLFPRIVSTKEKGKGDKNDNSTFLDYVGLRRK